MRRKNNPMIRILMSALHTDVLWYIGSCQTHYISSNDKLTCVQLHHNTLRHFTPQHVRKINNYSPHTCTKLLTYRIQCKIICPVYFTYIFKYLWSFSLTHKILLINYWYIYPRFSAKDINFQNTCFNWEIWHLASMEPFYIAL